MIKAITGYEGLYEISDDGVVVACEKFTSSGKHLKRKALKGGVYPNGYRYVCLRKDGINRNHMIHRLVANAFLNNPDDLPVVNHIDGNKENNSIGNLEWVTQAQNLKHALEIGLIESQCKIRRKVTLKRDEHIVMFDTMQDCSAFFGFKKGWLCGQIRKHGCTFQYHEYEIEVHGRED